MAHVFTSLLATPFRISRIHVLCFISVHPLCIFRHYGIFTLTQFEHISIGRQRRQGFGGFTQFGQRFNGVSEICNAHQCHADSSQSIVHPVNREDAIRLLEAAMAKKKMMELECELARSRLREAQVHTKMRNLKAKLANSQLIAANIHVSSINRVIAESGYGEILSVMAYTSHSQSWALSHMPVHSDGGGCRCRRPWQPIDAGGQPCATWILKMAVWRYIWISSLQYPILVRLVAMYVFVGKLDCLCYSRCSVFLPLVRVFPFNQRAVNLIILLFARLSVHEVVLVPPSPSQDPLSIHCRPPIYPLLDTICVCH